MVKAIVQDFQIPGDRSPEAPIVPQDFCDQRRVDSLIIPVTNGMLAQQHDGIDQILFVDLHDLHLLEQQLGQRQGVFFQLEPADKIDRVAKIKHVVKNVDVTAECRVMEKHTSVAEQLGNLLVFLITEFGQHPGDFAGKARIGGKIEIREHAPQLVLNITVFFTMGSEGQGANQPHDDVLVGLVADGFQDTRPLGIKILYDFAVFSHGHTSPDQPEISR